MTISIFDLFSIGIGPSSSHTVGPMKAACEFVNQLKDQGKLDKIVEIHAELYGSLALTGVGHGTHNAVLNGLEGKLPHTVDPDSVATRAQTIIEQKQICVAGIHSIPFIKDKHLLFHQREVLPLHTNGMRF